MGKGMTVHDHRNIDITWRDVGLKVKAGDTILAPSVVLYVYEENGRKLYHAGSYDDSRAIAAVKAANRLKGGQASSVLHFSGEYDERCAQREANGRKCLYCGADLTDKPGYPVGNESVCCVQDCRGLK
jgi:hypothetical protein